jgi:ABC-type transport system, involved in lipoprotein release, permease component
MTSKSSVSMSRFYLELAFKNLWRHKRRTILTMAAIAAGIFFYVVYDSMLTGTNQDMFKNLYDLEVGHFQVISAQDDSPKVPNLKHLIPDGPLVTAKLTTIPGVKAVAPRLVFPARLINGEDELPIIGVGVDPELDRGAFKIADYVQGRWVHKGETVVVVGRRVADLLQLKLGDSVTIQTQTKTNTFQAIDLTIVGLLDSPDLVVNENQIFIPLDITEQILGTGKAVSMVVVKATNIDNLIPVVDQVKKLQFPGFQFRIKLWEEAAASVMATIQMKRIFVYVLLLLVGIIAAIGVINSILLASLERVREIGILKAMGMTEAEITRLFAYEAVGLGLFGGVIGILLSFITNYYMVNVGIDIQKVYGKNFTMSVDKIYGIWNWNTFIFAFCAGLIIAFLAGWLPARRAAKVDPVISLRKV